MSLPATAKAVFAIEQGKTAVREAPVPQVRPGYILVKVKAVALNPTDWKSVHTPGGAAVGTKTGCDYAGVVEQVGADLAKPFARGDRVCGMVFGSVDPERGAFGEYVIAPSHLSVRVPDNLSFEQAATLGVGITTVGQGLYQFLGLPLPSATPTTAEPEPEPAAAGATTSPDYLLIYGGSTATGILGIQFARQSGLTVLATASPHNFEYLKSLGAEAVFDYHTPAEELAAQIRSHTRNTLVRAWDCSPTAESARLCALSMSDAREGAYGGLLPVPAGLVASANPKVTRSGFTMGYSAFGEAFSRGKLSWDARPEDAEFGRRFWDLSRELLAQGRITVAKMEVNRGGEGLDGVVVGLDELREGKVSGTKLVYTL